MDEPRRYDIDLCHNGEHAFTEKAYRSNGDHIAFDDPAIQRALRIAAWAKEHNLVDDNGEPRKILGTLPVTADGAIVGHKAVMYWWNRWTGAWIDTAEFDRDDFSRHYSTREAAERAAKERSDGQ